MDFSKKPSHIIVLALMCITIFVMFVVPVLTFFGFFPTDVETDISDLPESLRLIFDIFIVAMQLTIIIFLLIIIPFLWYKFVNNLSLKEIYSQIRLTVEGLDRAILWGFVSVIFTFILFFIIGFILVSLGIDTNELSNIPDIEQYISTPIALFILASVQPIAEEVFFRGFLLDKIEGFAGTNVAIFSTAVLFGIAHMVYGEIYPAVFPIIIGIILGYIVVKTRNLYSSIIAHVLFNATSLILYFFAISLYPESLIL